MHKLFFNGDKNALSGNDEFTPAKEYEIFEIKF